MEWQLTSETRPSGERGEFIKCLVWCESELETVDSFEDDPAETYVVPSHAETCTWDVDRGGWLISSGICPKLLQVLYELGDPDLFPYWVKLSDVPGPR